MSRSLPNTSATAFSGESSGKLLPLTDAWTCVCTSMATRASRSMVGLIRPRSLMPVGEADEETDIVQPPGTGRRRPTPAAAANGHNEVHDRRRREGRVAVGDRGTQGAGRRDGAGGDRLVR